MKIGENSKRAWLGWAAAELVNLAEEDRDIERRVMLLIREEDPVALGAKLKRRIAGLDLQRVDVARRYLECGQAEPAIARLEAMEDRANSARWQLLAEAYGRIGQRDEQVRCLWRLFEGSAHFGTYVELLKLLPTGERAKTKQRAIGLALALGDVLSAASFLLRVGACADAERLTIERVAELEGTYYGHLKFAGRARRGQRSPTHRNGLLPGTPQRDPERRAKQGVRPCGSVFPPAGGAGPRDR